MPLAAGKSLIQTLLRWQLSKDNGAFDPTVQPGEESFSYAPDEAVLNHVFAKTYIIAAAATQVVDFRSFTNLVGEAVTGTKIAAVYVAVEAGTGTLKIEPDATDGLLWPFVAAAPAYTMKPSATSGAQWLHCDGTVSALDATHKEWLLTASGAAINVTIAAFVGT